MGEETTNEESKSEYQVMDHHNGQPFADVYVLDKELGRGAFSTVKLGHHKETGESYAIKSIIKKEMWDFDKVCLKHELDVMKTLPPHDHIISLHDVFDEEDFVHLVLEKVDGGELLERIIQKNSYDECEARDVCKIIMEAMRHCHSHKIAHRDIKPENLLMASTTDDTSIKIADFGFAKYCPEDDSLKTQCGSAMHVAPEILTKTPYGTSVDCWALGVVMFTIIGGAPPFYGESNQATFKKILAVDYEFYEDYWGEITDDCKDMIKGLLTKEMKDRWTVQQCLDCAWMNDAPKKLRRASLLPNMKKLMEFNAKRKMKAAVQALNFATSMPGFDGDVASAMHDESVVESCRRLNDHRSPIED